MLKILYRTIPTSNHNPSSPLEIFGIVVYRTIPTSNHNLHAVADQLYGLYIVLFLHQTTTGDITKQQAVCCISYYSYIKPQLFFPHSVSLGRCISYYSYIKPQLKRYITIIIVVVYRTIPTSNHN